MSLPILDILPEVKKALNAGNTLILQAPPGAGKSTVLPLELIKEPWLKEKKILMLEPRRLAARAVANRMASLLEEETGETVGYRIRFENKTGPHTKIEVVTEGILTRMLQQDNLLEGTGLVIFDEFHERSLHADLALALCREVQQVLRDDLKILIMSATLDGDKISSLLDKAPVLTSEGRQHPVNILYLPQEKNTPPALDAARAIRKALQSHEGDVLCFLPGAGEISKAQELLEAEEPGISIHPLYGDLPQQKQQEAILPHPYERRKVILSTSIAETSLTIEGIRIVVDSGYSRIPRFDPRSGLTRLETVQVTKDSAAQRAGRAGRLGPGVCYRLWQEGIHQHLREHRTPEILEADLAPMMLELAQWKVKDIESLTWLTPPPAGAVSQAKDLLRQLDALNDKGEITSRGMEMLKLPTHPRIAHLLLEAKKHGLLPLATDMAALLEERDPLSKESGADLNLRIEALRKYRNKNHIPADRKALDRIERLASFWRKAFRIDPDNSPPMQDHTGMLIAAAYPERVARQQEQDQQRYRLANGRLVRLPDHDVLFREKWLAVAHLDAGKNEGKIYLAAALNPQDIMHRVQDKEVINWDAQKGMLIARKEKNLGDILVQSSPLENIPEEARVKALCEAVKTEGLKLFTWSDEIYQWQARVLSLKKWRMEEDWPDVSEKNLMETIDEWLPPYLAGIRKREDFKKADVKGMLSGILSWDLGRKLDYLAPEKLKVPSGSMITLRYAPDGSHPVLAVRLQEMFGLLDTPAINEGRIKVLLHLLSPGYKPVQVTQDLKSFWQNTYPQVRKELRVRYQKHHWPEDPWTAEAVRGARKRKG